MALCSMKELVRSAQKDRKAVGAFNVGNMEILIGAIRAAEEANTPIILQLAEKRLKHSPLELMAPMIVNAAKHAKVDVAVQLDHGCSEKIIRQAIEYGFTSVMYDGSDKTLAENIRCTRQVLAEAAAHGVNVEAEIGVLGGSEGGGEKDALCTRPQDAKAFMEEVACDALAVAIGNAHGHYHGEPHLHFDVLEQIHRIIPTPLVLHGGSGISAQDFRRTIDCGVCKINIATALFDAFVEGSRSYVDSGAQELNYFSLNEAAVASVYEAVRRHIKIFNNREEL